MVLYINTHNTCLQDSTFCTEVSLCFLITKAKPRGKRSVFNSSKGNLVFTLLTYSFSSIHTHSFLHFDPGYNIWLQKKCSFKKQLLTWHAFWIKRVLRWSLWHSFQPKSNWYQQTLTLGLLPIPRFIAGSGSPRLENVCTAQRWLTQCFTFTTLCSCFFYWKLFLYFLTAETLAGLFT